MPGAIVVGGTRGIGAAIAAALREAGCGVTAAGRADVDTSDLASVEAFAARNPETDVLVLNTGGPPPAEFADTGRADWEKYHRQLLLGPCELLRRIRVRDGGYVFAVTSSVVRAPSPRLVISGAYRAALTSVLKALGPGMARRGVSCVCIAPGPTDTGRMRELVDDVGAFAAGLPMGRMCRPEEIGAFVGAVVGRRIGYLAGATVPFDGAGAPYAP